MMLPVVQKYKPTSRQRLDFMTPPWTKLSMSTSGPLVHLQLRSWRETLRSPTTTPTGRQNQRIFEGGRAE
ncbi:uncharacterized protein PgNI_11682 [Pyricularia grisea]|uniref:Uncharacterized protein n=1 Tax=Pyricularia grisea TaxID=148305 RepID=A0A6P8ANH7_PYRGI|nr:uncharacterized protein PgNI_11682 [Pyricularia grisea]TLD03585.1 hypothetical protein PgNI_11682 [Pyricularia grisea]